MKFFVDLNSDIGEGYGAYKLGMDEEIMKCVTIAILDGVLYIAGRNRMFADLARFDDNEVVVSAVLLRDYLFSV